MNAFQLIKKSGGKVLVLISFVLAFQGIIGASSANASCLTSTQMESLSPTSGSFETCGGDDISYKIPISGSVIFGGVTYTSVYATTNSVISFGVGDNNYYSFPNTPSISLDAFDWVQDGYWGDGGVNDFSTGTNRDDEFFNITVSGETFRVDIAARLYSTYSTGSTYNGSVSNYVPQGSITRLILNFVRQADGTLRISSFSSDAANLDLRNGCVLSEGAAAISLTDCGILQVATIEEILNEMPSNYLVATTPLVVSQTKDAITCTSATLKYMADGVQSDSLKLTAQTYAVKVEGKIVAHKSTLDSSASFDKKLLPTSGVATCSQTATQGGSQVTVESEVSSATGDAAKVRKAEIAKILADFKVESQKLMSAKLSLLGSANADAYREATQQWSSALLAARIARDTAIEAANSKEIKSVSDAGVKISIQP
jgi:hypothetical protein